MLDNKHYTKAEKTIDQRVLSIENEVPKQEVSIADTVIFTGNLGVYCPVLFL
jgi:hypothetical protein